MTHLIKRKGYTLIPLMLYFNDRNIVKILLGVAKGKKKYDKRELIKTRELQRNSNLTKNLL